MTIAELLRSEDPRSVKYAAKILEPIADDWIELLTAMFLPGLVVRAEKTALMAMLRLLQRLTCASREICSQCTEAQLFSFAGIHERGFRIRSTWMGVLENVVRFGYVPTDESSRKTIEWVLESAIEGDEEGNVMTALRLAAILSERGFEFEFERKIEELAGQERMGQLAECAQIFLRRESERLAERRKEASS
jgi:hypothetical protein